MSLPFDPSDTPANKLLAALPLSEYQRLLPHLKPFDLPLGEVLYERGDKIHRIYFVTSGLTSFVLSDEDGHDVEVGVAGNEGCVDLYGVLTGEPSKLLTIVQIQGTALALPTEVVRQEFQRAGALQAVLLRYSQALLMQASQTAFCNVRHPVEERLCRLLLTVADRIGADEFDITQEYLSAKLGTRQSSVLVAASILRANGLLDYTNRHISLLDRPGLEGTSCQCYGAMREHFKRMRG